MLVFVIIFFILRKDLKMTTITIFHPSQDLNTIVDRYWIMESPTSTENLTHPIIPNGRIKFLFNFADVFMCYYNHPAIPDCLRQPSVVGQIDGVLSVSR